jgi:hypothetical protein
MKKIFLIGLCISGLLLLPAYAQEKGVDSISVNLGVLSWEKIQEESKEKPATHSEEFHRRMAKSMLEMHAGGGKGTYHIMIVLRDRYTGETISDAHVWVTATAQTGPEEITHEMKPMTMDGDSAYGEFFKLTFPGLYVFHVKINRESMEPTFEGKTYTVDIERTIPPDK